MATPTGATALVRRQGSLWVGFRRHHGRDDLAAELGPAWMLTLTQACDRWAQALRHGGWVLAGRWADDGDEAWVPIARLADVRDQRLHLVPAPGDRPRLTAT